MKDIESVIRPCKKKDKDSRPGKEQKVCLYTSDGSKLLGRHPSKEKALRQERAIQKHKHSNTISKEFAKMALNRATSEWWNSLSIDEQRRHLKRHPGSHYKLRARDIPIGTAQFNNGQYRLLTHDKGWIAFDQDEHNELEAEKERVKSYLDDSRSK